MTDRYLAIAEAMNRGWSDFKPFPESFHLFQDPNGVKVLLQSDPDGVVRFVSEETITEAIVRYCTHELAKEEGYRFDFATAKKCMQFWKAVTEPVAEPQLLREKSEPGLCFKRLPFDLTPDPDRCPVTSEFLSRCGNADALQIFLGGLLVENASRHQYVWCWGLGGDGKSSLLRMIARFLGDQYHAEDANFTDSKFWTSAIIGKRLVGFPDCNNYALPMTGLFKSMTGDDKVRVERKNKDPYSTQLRCMVMVLSNQPPQLSGHKADMRRAIICEVQPIRGDEDQDYDEKLWQEAPYFFGCCKARYLEACAGGKKIPVDTMPAEMIALESEEVYEQAFNAHFKRCGVSHYDKGHAIPAHILKRWIEVEGIKKGSEQRKFVLYIKRKFGVRYARSASGGFYYGIKLLEASEKEAALRSFVPDDVVEKLIMEKSSKTEH
jgi:phage/plasmid-associated DNA primase